MGDAAERRDAHRLSARDCRGERGGADAGAALAEVLGVPGEDRWLLARVQMQASFDALLRRTPTLEVDGPPALLRSSFQRDVKRLPLRWTAT